MDKALIGKRIKEFRSTHGWNQKSFAEKLGINQGALSQIEHGHVAPSLELVMRIVGLGYISYEWLLADEKLKPPAALKSPKEEEPESEKLQRGVIERIKKLMQQEKLSEASFAIRCRIKQERLEEILNHAAVPALDELLKILLTFSSYNANWILKNEGGRKVQEGQQAIEELLRHKDEILNMMKGSRGKSGQ